MIIPLTSSSSIVLAEDTAEIIIYDAIGDGWFGGVSAVMVSDELAKLKGVKNITVRLNSPGGNAYDGIAIYNRLKEHKAKIQVEIDGMAASAASVIAMAGDVIRMADNAIVMIHNGWTEAVGGVDEFLSMAERLGKLNASIASTYVARTGQKLADVVQMMDDETYMSSKEALALGFATEISEAKRVAACIRPGCAWIKNPPAQLQNQANEPTEAEQKKAELAALRARIDAAKNNQPAGATA